MSPPGRRCVENCRLPTPETFAERARERLTVRNLLLASPMQACKDFGFFYLENHGVSEEVMAEVFRQSKAFFSLAISDKLAVKADKNNRGFTPMHEEILDPAKQAKGDTKVFLTIAAWRD